MKDAPPLIAEDSSDDLEAEHALKDASVEPRNGLLRWLRKTFLLEIAVAATVLYFLLHL